MSRTEQYETLLRQIEGLAAGETNSIGMLANAAAAMKAAFPEKYFWVGFYMVGEDARRKERVLQLGPFQGPVACTTIRYGQGVCGAAWKQKAALIVDDVEEFPGHIACSSESRSEIVVPICSADGQVLGVIDIDSTKLKDFDDTDQRYLTSIAKILAKELRG